MHSLRIGPAGRSLGQAVGAVCLALVFLVGAVVAQAPRTPIKTGKIYIGSFGMGDDAEQLKLALGYELSRAGFKVTDFEPQADSTLTGLIVTRVESGRPVKRVTVFLKDKSGKQIWNEDIGSTSSASRSAQEAIRQRAEDITKALKKASTAPKAVSTAKN